MRCLPGLDRWIEGWRDPHGPWGDAGLSGVCAHDRVGSCEACETCGHAWCGIDAEGVTTTCDDCGAIIEEEEDA